MSLGVGGGAGVEKGDGEGDEGFAYSSEPEDDRVSSPALWTLPTNDVVVVASIAWVDGKYTSTSLLPHRKAPTHTLAPSQSDSKRTKTCFESAL